VLLLVRGTSYNQCTTHSATASCSIHSMPTTLPYGCSCDTTHDKHDSKTVMCSNPCAPVKEHRVNTRQANLAMEVSSNHNCSWRTDTTLPPSLLQVA
jgi:hypothetical protein